MGLLKREKPRLNGRIQRSATNDLLAYSETALNTIGRALEAYRSGDPAGILLAVDEANLLRDMLAEVHARDYG